MLLNDSIETWPHVFAAIAFYSNGFPINKVIAYAKMHGVTIVNGTLMF